MSSSSNSNAAEDVFSLTVELSGGAELLFKGVKRHQVLCSALEMGSNSPLCCFLRLPFP